MKKGSWKSEPCQGQSSCFKDIVESRGWFVYTHLFVLARKRIRGRTGSPKWSDTDTRMILAGQTPTKMILAPPKYKTYCAQGTCQGVYDLPSAVHL